MEEYNRDRAFPSLDLKDAHETCRYTVVLNANSFAVFVQSMNRGRGGVVDQKVLNFCSKLVRLATRTDWYVGLKTHSPPIYPKTFPTCTLLRGDILPISSYRKQFDICMAIKIDMRFYTVERFSGWRKESGPVFLMILSNKVHLMVTGPQ